MSDAILKGEAYCRLHTIHKHYRRLQKHDFPTAGPEGLVNLTSAILGLMLQRFHKYTSIQVKHILQVCSTFETIYGYLSESKLSSVPWSIIPALEGLFSRVQKGKEFAICPIWENNYKVITSNIVAMYKDIASAGDLLFDSKTAAELDDQMNKLFGVHPDGIYFLFFPRMERASAVHFALLGHEIGHIYSDQWIASEFGPFLVKHNIEASFEKIAKSAYAKLTSGVKSGPDIFVAGYIMSEKANRINMCLKVMREIIADLYGAMVFGDPALVAQYLFFLGKDIDDAGQWQDGYPSPRLRMKLTRECLDYVRKIDKFPVAIKSGWESTIEACVNAPTCDGNNDEYIQAFLGAVKAGLATIFDQVGTALDTHVFTRYVEEVTISASVERLKIGVPPNVQVDPGGQEVPVDFRNILYASTRCLANEVPTNLDEYECNSRMINLLGIKGIELSMEQERFKDYDSHKS